MYDPHAKQPEDFVEEITKRQGELLQAQQDEFIRKKKQQEANRLQLVEQRALRIAELTNADLSVVQE